jgi:hypothetical protein
VVRGLDARGGILIETAGGAVACHSGSLLLEDDA